MNDSFLAAVGGIFLGGSVVYLFLSGELASRRELNSVADAARQRVIETRSVPSKVLPPDPTRDKHQAFEYKPDTETYLHLLCSEGIHEYQLDREGCVRCGQIP